MITYPDAFLAELDKQIRRRGRCTITIYLSDNDSITVAEESIQSVEYTLRNDPMCRELPTEECVFTLLDFDKTWNPDNPSGRYADAGAGDRVSVRFGIDTAAGTTSYGFGMTFFLKQNPEWRDNMATFTATRQIGRLKKEFYEFGNSETLGSLAEKAIKAGLADVGYAEQDMRYDIESDLLNVGVIQNTTLEGYTCADALMAIALAGGKNLRTQFGETVGIVQVRDLLVEHPQRSSAVVSRRDMLSFPVSDKLPLIKNEIITYYKEPRENAESTVVLHYSGSEISGNDHVFLPTDLPIIPTPFSISGATNVSGAIFARGFYRNGIIIWGINKQDPSQPIEFDGTARPITKTPATITVPVNVDGVEDERIDNPLINARTYEDVSAYRGAYLTNARSKFEIDYRGDPSIEPLDLIRVELPFIGFAVCIVLEAKFKFSSGFSGSLIVRKLDTVAANQQIQSAISGCAVSDEAISDRSV